MTRQELVHQIRTKKSFLCIGLDTDINKIPELLRSQPDAILQFNKAIIDATKDLCVSYKINTAFYEALGSKGWDIMEQTLHYIPSTHFKIADAKRADIGNTSSYYAKAFFETLPFDAITVAPYMGEDSIRPFLEYENKWTIILGLTSNEGSKDFEMLTIKNEKANFLYEQVLQTASKWGNENNVMFVVGATKSEEFKSIRKILPNHFLLVPGIGAQGGNLKDVAQAGLNKECGLLVNASRAIIYAGNGIDFAAQASMAAEEYRNEMKTYLDSINE